MKRIKWKNVIYLMFLLGCIGVVIYDIWTLLFSQFITGYLATWTWLGLGTFILSSYVMINCYNELKKDFK